MGIKSNNTAESYYNFFGASGHDAGNAAPLGDFSATGGDVVTSPYPDSGATYKAHIFTTSGSFVVTGDPNSVEYLVVGGGGGAGSYYSGGGGGGGFRSSLPGIAPGGPGTSVETALTLGQGTYTVTIGAGGAGGSFVPTQGGTASRGASGGNSVFATITSQGGGGSGHEPGPEGPGYNGGSGGGVGSSGSASTGGLAGYERQTTGTGSPTPVQGYPGADGGPWPGAGYSATGGGGAGSSGGSADGTPPGGGPGGAGKAIPTTMFGPTTPSYGAPGPSAGRWFAGGGGGSSYNFPGAAGQDGTGGSFPSGGGPYAGAGDGGVRPASENSEAGTSNTGGGAGGTAPAAPDNTPKAGGSGIVMVRYQV